MKREDTLDLGNGIALGEKIVSQLMNNYGVLYLALDSVVNKREEKEIVDDMDMYYTEVHRRILWEPPRTSGNRAGV